MDAARPAFLAEGSRVLALPLLTRPSALLCDNVIGLAAAQRILAFKFVCFGYRQTWHLRSASSHGRTFQPAVFRAAG